MSKKQKEVAVAVQAVVSAPEVKPAAVVTAAVVPDMAIVRELGFDAANYADRKAAIVGQLAALLKDQPFPVWELVRTAFIAGALRATPERPSGYAAPDKLWERFALKPLATLGINKPASDKSSAVREVSAETKAKQDAAKAERDKLAAMTVAEVRKELDTCTDDARKAKLYTAMVARDKADKAAAAKAIKDSLTKLRTSCIEIIKAADNKAVLQKMHAALTKCIPASK